VGESLALLTAVVWAFGVVLFKFAGNHTGPFALNFFKNTVSIVLLVASMAVLGESFFPEVTARDYMILLVSGAIGVGLSDTLFLYTLKTLGAGRTALVDCLYSPFVILFSFWFLGERLTGLQFVGGGLILAGVALSSLERRDGELSLGKYVGGVLAGAVSMACMGVAVVMMKPFLNSYSVLWVNVTRMVGGLAVLILVLPFHSGRGAVWRAFRPGKAWKTTVPASFVASYLSLIVWVAGMKYTQTNIAALLNQTSVVWIVVLAAIFLKEPFTKVKTIAVAIAVGGSILVIL
jgi:drug/metabolite transporter (DMT)-like permease